MSCAGGELLVADSPPIENGYQGPLPTFRSVISIPPVVNRLVLFSPGILHRINPFEGERYSVAVNIWEQAPLTTTCLLYTSPSPRDQRGSRMPSSA